MLERIEANCPQPEGLSVRVSCPRCHEELELALWQYSPRKCRCGFDWCLDLTAYGTRELDSEAESCNPTCGNS